MKTFTAKARTSFFLNMEPSIINSGMNAPAPPMMRARTMPIPMPFPIRAVLIGITVLARKDKPGPKKQSNELALLEFSLARTYYFERLWVVVANEEGRPHSELIKPLSQKRIVIEVKYGNEEEIDNSVSLYRQLMQKPDGRGMDKEA